MATRHIICIAMDIVSTSRLMLLFFFPLKYHSPIEIAMHLAMHSLWGMLYFLPNAAPCVALFAVFWRSSGYNITDVSAYFLVYYLIDYKTCTICLSLLVLYESAFEENKGIEYLTCIFNAPVCNMYHCAILFFIRSHVKHGPCHVVLDCWFRQYARLCDYHWYIYWL